MVSKCIILGLVVFLAMQSSTEAKSLLKVDDNQTLVSQLLTELSTYVTIATSESDKIFNNAMTALKLRASSVFHEARNQVDSILSDANIRIVELNKQAEEQGVPADICIDNQIEQLNNLASVIADTGKTCLDDKIYLAFSFTQEFKMNLFDFELQVISYQAEYINCGNEQCYGALLTMVQALSDNVKSTIPQQQTSTVEQIQSVQATLISCYDFNIKQFGALTKDMLQEVEDCIKEQIATQPQPESRGLETRDWDTVVAIIEKLKNLAKDKITQAIEKLSEIVEAINKAAADIIKKGQETLAKLIKGMVNTIEALVQKATDLNIDVTDCVANHKEEINEVADKAVADITGCVAQNVEDHKGILVLIQDKVKDVYADVEALEKDALACDGALCYGKVFLKANGLLLSLPIKIGKLLIEAGEIIVKAQVKGAICAKDSIKEFTSKTTPIVQSVTKCVADKIAEHKQL